MRVALQIKKCVLPDRRLKTKVNDYDGRLLLLVISIRTLIYVLFFSMYNFFFFFHQVPSSV